jgi:secreted Zn-dependent insulinase-like peptidase
MNLKPGMAFYVQSPKTAAADLYNATVIFYRKFLEELPEIPAEDFNQIKASLIAQIRERDTSLASRAKRIWLAIGQGDFACTLSQQIQDELAALTLQEFCDFCYTLLAPEYDAVFLATGPAPEHSAMRSKTAAQLASELELRTDWL